MAVAGMQNAAVFGDSQHGRVSNRASTLLQIWREIEGGENLDNQSIESQDSFDTVNQHDDVISEQSCDLGGIERERVRQIFKEWMNSGSKGGLNLKSNCGRQTLVDLLIRVQSERKREVVLLLEQKLVSNFAHRHRIQALLKGRFLRNERLVEDERSCSSAATELGLLRQRHAVSDLRDEFLSKFDNSASTSSNVDSNKQESEFKCCPETEVQIITEVQVNGYTTDVEGNTREGFDLHDASSHGDGLNESVNEIEDEMRSFPESFGCQWSPETSHTNISDEYQRHESRQGGSLGRFHGIHFHHDGDADVRRMELTELFGRQCVSSLLHSDFRDSLDRVLRSHSERLRYASEDWEHDNASQDIIEQDQPFWGEEFPSANWPHQEWDIINELRIDIVRLHRRMNDMQSVLEECMDMQIELQRAVRQEVLVTLNRIISSRDSDQPPDNRVHNESDPWDHVRKGVCCLCRDSKIDSLLYRCGHMCTCFKCAEKLIRDKEKCPMCQAPVVEVVRAYFVQ